MASYKLPPSDPFTNRFAYETTPAQKTTTKSARTNGGEPPHTAGSRVKKIPRPSSRNVRSTFDRVAQLVTIAAVITCITIYTLGVMTPSIFSSDVLTSQHSAPLFNHRSTDSNGATPPEPDDPQPSFPSVHTSMTPELEAYVHKIVSSALRDPVGLRDFALHSLGARVLPELTIPKPARPWTKSPSLQSAPEAALRENFHIGECWLVRTGSAQLEIGLPHIINPTHVTIDHIPLEISPDIGQAPRKILLWGLVDGKHNLRLYHEGLLGRSHDLHPTVPGRQGPPVSGLYRFVLLASFEYNIFAPLHIQTFPVNPVVADMGFSFGIVVLEIVENWGADTTCLYRVRIHGNKLSA